MIQQLANQVPNNRWIWVEPGDVYVQAESGLSYSSAITALESQLKIFYCNVRSTRLNTKEGSCLQRMRNV